MKSHKRWGIAAFICMIMTMISGYRMKSKDAHKYWAIGAMITMTMAMYSGCRMIHKKPNKKKEADDLSNQ